MLSSVGYIFFAALTILKIPMYSPSEDVTVWRSPFDEPPIPYISPFLRQSKEQVAVELPNFSCGLCGADIGSLLDGFCSLCTLKQQRVGLDVVYSQAIAHYSDAKMKLQQAKEALKANTAAQKAQRKD